MSPEQMPACFDEENFSFPFSTAECFLLASERSCDIRTSIPTCFRDSGLVGVLYYVVSRRQNMAKTGSRLAVAILLFSNLELQLQTRRQPSTDT